MNRSNFGYIVTMALLVTACGGGGGGGGGDYGGGGGDYGGSNNAPTFTNSTFAYSAEENQTSAFTATASDADGDSLTFNISSGSDADLFAIGSSSGTEALFNEPDTGFSNDDAAGDLNSTAMTGTNPAVLNNSSPGTYVTGGADYGTTTGGGMTTGEGEALGDAAANSFAEMAFSIEKSTVTAKSRALKAEYTMELAQDLKAIHGLDAETELSNILSSEILAEINREVIRTIYVSAKKGASVNTTTAGIFDLDTDSNGRWSVEKFKGLMFQIERDANVIAQETRRGKGNMIITSSDVASALQMAGVLDYAPALNNNLQVDDTGNTFAGVLNGRYRVYIDPYAANNAASQYYVVGYKGTSPYDAGIFYCPYVPLQMVRAVGENTFQPKIGFKTRYGVAQNPFATSDATDVVPGANDNTYYRRVQVANLM